MYVYIENTENQFEFQKKNFYTLKLLFRGRLLHKYSFLYYFWEQYSWTSCYQALWGNEANVKHDEMLN